MVGRAHPLIWTAWVALLTAGCAQGGSSGGGAASTAAGVTSGSTQGAQPTAQVLASGTVRVLTYNVAGLPQGLSSSSPATNTRQISPKLNAYELVLAQEDFWYHADLERDATHPFRSTPLTGYSTLVNDGLNRFSNTPFSDFARVRWSRCNGFTDQGNDCLSSKGFSVGRHELWPGATVDVYNLHADAGGGAGDAAARRHQFEELARYIQLYSAGRALLVGGDTNLKHSRPDDEQVLLTFLAATGLRDVARTLGAPESIDRLMFRSSAEVELAPVLWRQADEMVDAGGAPLSDHAAIHVDVEWRYVK